ncbi:MAG: outer membrane beta-barrel protein [Nitrosomonadales bacterium]|nr:outer membrane beta-barrel protein [Nitrosomonadales bacterium]
MRKPFHIVIAGTLTLLMSAGAYADTLPFPAKDPVGPNEGYYVGGSYGNFNDKVVNGSDSAWKFFGGYRVVSTEIELGYVNLGKVSESTDAGDITSETTGYSLTLVDHVPMTTDLTLFARIGVFHWKSDVSDTASGTEAGDRDNGTDLTYGLGLQYDISQSFGVRAEWERFGSDVGDLVSVGLVVNF